MYEYPEISKMTYKEFKEFCNERACDGRWSFLEAISCLKIIEEIDSIKVKGLFKKKATERAREAEWLTIFVKDDGDGFSAKALKEAKKLYYSEDKGMSNHFGMGLYISEKLCEKHGGNLTLVNGMDQGAIVAARFRVNSKINYHM